jgi:acetyltransferase
MSLRNLSALFRPKSVTVIGASPRKDSVGGLVLRNLLQGSFPGPIMPVNPKHKAISGVLTYPDIASLPVVPEMAVICTPSATVPGLIRELGARGVKAAIVISAGRKDGIEAFRKEISEAAKPFNMRVLGPNSLGLLSPGAGLNASFAAQPALKGKIAFVSQSGAVCTAVLDWARPKGIGFSQFVSVGDCANVGFGDVLDYLGSDPDTRAILLYIQSIDGKRNFMSAARAAARNKPVLCIKAGHKAESARAVVSHTGALLTDTDPIYDAAIRRAGMLRVGDIDELFAAVETLARAKPTHGERLAILTNGGGIGVMAVDDLIERDGHLSELSDETISKLDAVLPEAWSRGNPLDILGDSDSHRYETALRILLDAPEVDAILVMHTPTAVTSASGIAETIIEVAQKAAKPIMSCWAGEETAAPARKLFNVAGLPTYETPRRAIRAFLHLTAYRRNQKILMEIPPSLPSEFTPATEAARLIVESALASGRTQLSEPEAKAVLSAYGIPTVETHIARTPADASRVAKQMGGRVALKILSSDITHKSDIGGVRLDLDNPLEVEKAAYSMLDRVKVTMPEAVTSGFSVQRMARRPGAHELIIGVMTDPVFGPVILFGEGGTGVEVIADHAVALPPLNMKLARELISETRIARLLKGYRGRAPVDLDAICLTLVKISQMVIDFPELVELDINPLFADRDGVLALDAFIRLTPTPLAIGQRMAIRPYPKALEEFVHLRDERKVMLRPIRPEDEPDHHIFVSKMSHDDLRLRFFGSIDALPHTEMARLTQIDYDREMAFIATAPDAEGNPETLGVVRTVTDPDNEEAEYAIAIRSDLKGQGLGRILMDKIISYSRSRGTKAIIGQILHENRRMLELLKKLGFKRVSTEDGVVEVRLDL